jgi:type 1 glutamine amidotransferase/nicotinamidase-related amidase
MNSFRSFLLFWSVASCFLISIAAASEPTLRLQLRTRVETAPSSGRWHALSRPANWNPRETAIVICDMWNDHYCIAAARRVAEMAPHMNRVISAARERGVLILHCPSGVLDKYEGSPQRQLAKQAPPVPTGFELNKWCYINPLHEMPLPVSDKDPCDEPTPRPAVKVFDRQIDTLEIKEGDAITDSAEAFYLMKQRGITNVLIMGVHTNMCVLGRPFGIRQLIYHGMNVALMRDLTDTMYNPKQPPFVSHFSGNDLVFEHIERYWCPTVTSADILGGEPFRFAADKRKHLVIVMAEDEYQTEQSLPKFALEQLGHDFRVSVVYENWLDKNDLPGLEVLDSADVALWSIRRKTFPRQQLDRFQQYITSGKPLVAIRTASHAFCLRNTPAPAGLADWTTFDAEVLGGNYSNHHGNDLPTVVKAVSQAGSHPILAGVRSDEFRVFGSLYKTRPLAESAKPLMFGRVEGAEPEPVAWTNTTKHGGRVFYTSLGHAGDFEIPDFQRLLKNGIQWAAGSESPTQPASGCCDR